MSLHDGFPGRRQGSAEFGEFGEFTELVVNPHVPIQPPESFTLGLGQTDGQYSQSFNRRYRRSRHLWQERFRLQLTRPLPPAHRARLGRSQSRRRQPEHLEPPDTL